MSKADDMFKELGYEKIKEDTNFICYEQKQKPHTTIEHTSPKTFNSYIVDEIYKYRIDFNLEKMSIIKDSAEYEGRTFITMQELKAINEKCKELGWLDE